MGSLFDAAAALTVTAVGGVAAFSASAGDAFNWIQYLVGHVLLGAGLGFAIVIELRLAARRLVSRLGPAKGAGSQAAPPASSITLLPSTPRGVVPIRNRHAA